MMVGGVRGAVGQTRGTYPGVGICRASLGPDQEDEEALSCPAPTEVPQGHPNKQRQLEHSVAKVAGKESWCSGGITVASSLWDQLICIPRRVWQK